MLLGFVFVAPVYVAFVMLGCRTVQPLSSWRVGVVLLGSVVVGGLVGLRTCSLSRNKWSEPKTDWRFVAVVAATGLLLAVVMFLAWW